MCLLSITKVRWFGAFSQLKDHVKDLDDINNKYAMPCLPQTFAQVTLPMFFFLGFGILLSIKDHVDNQCERIVISQWSSWHQHILTWLNTWKKSSLRLYKIMQNLQKKKKKDLHYQVTFCWYARTWSAQPIGWFLGLCLIGSCTPEVHVSLNRQFLSPWRIAMPSLLINNTFSFEYKILNGVCLVCLSDLIVMECF